MRRKDPELYKRNKGKCRRCDSEVGPFAVIHLDNFSFHICHACQIKALLVTEAPSPKKKKVIQEGLADAEARRTSKVNLSRMSSPYIP